MKKPNQKQLSKDLRTATSGSDRRLLLEHLENRQLLAGDLAPPLRFVVLENAQAAPPEIISFVESNAAQTRHSKDGSVGAGKFSKMHPFHVSDARGAGASRVDTPMNRGVVESRMAGQIHSPSHLISYRGFGSQTSQSDGFSSSANMAPGRTGSSGHDGFGFFSETLGLNTGRTVISSRLTEAAMLPALPPGFELIERITVTQTPSVPQSSNQDATPSTTAVFVFKNNNIVPPEIVAVVDNGDAEVENDINRLLSSSSRGGLEAEGEGPSRDLAGQPSISVASDGVNPESVDSELAATALDDVLNEYFVRHAISNDQVGEQMSGDVRAQVSLRGEEVSLAAFFDSISGELRRSGMSREQVAELESLLKQIIEADPDVRDNGTFVATEHASWVQYSRRGVHVYDFSGNMMAVPIDGSSLTAGPLDAVAEMTSNAWTQRFGLADIALAELGSFANGTELGALPLAELGEEDADGSWDFLPTGLISESWRSSVGKASLVAAACLATTRLHQRSTARSLATDAKKHSRPCHPR